MIQLTKEGNRISYDGWRELMADENYKYQRRYENDKFKVEVYFVGILRAQNMTDIPREHWKLYEMGVFNKIKNKNGEIEYAKDPSVTTTHNTEQEAILAYQEFLNEYTECHYDTHIDCETFEEVRGEFVEVGNIRASDSVNFDESAKEFLKDYQDTDEAGSW